jgi:hypothetical protein
MYTISYKEFMRLVETRRRHMEQKKAHSGRKQERERERVLRPDQKIVIERPKHDRKLATCPACDEVVDAEILNPYSGLCPVCHELAQRRR